MKRRMRRRMSFTLIEVVVVIIILVTLASIATPLYLNYVKPRENCWSTPSQDSDSTPAHIRIPRPDSAHSSKTSIRTQNGPDPTSNPPSRKIPGAMTMSMSIPASTENSTSSATAPTVSPAVKAKTQISPTISRNNFLSPADVPSQDAGGNNQPPDRLSRKCP